MSRLQNAVPRSIQPKALLGLGILLVVAVCAAGQRGLPAQDGIGNFGKVSDGLYRGAQPDAQAIKNLKQLGIKTIINLRMANDVWKEEEAEARANGITYTNLPFKGLGRPTGEQVKTALAIIGASGPVFIHCKHGCDRTGTIVACYRIQQQKWTGASALQEAEHYGMSSLELGMKRFVADFAVQFNPPVIAKPAPIAKRSDGFWSRLFAAKRAEELPIR